MTRTDRSTWPDVLYPADMAVIWNRSVRTIRRMHTKGYLPDAAHGAELTWIKADVIAWFDNPKIRNLGQRRRAA